MIAITAGTLLSAGSVLKVRATVPGLSNASVSRATAHRRLRSCPRQGMREALRGGRLGRFEAGGFAGID